MSMVKFDVDTSAKLFICKVGVTSFDVQIDLYSDAKEHWLAGGVAMGYDFPVRTVAGDLRSDSSIVEPFYFLRDGWKIRPQESNHTLNVTGNIELDTGETGELFVPTLGTYTVLVRVNTTNRGSIVSSDVANVASAVWAYLIETGFNAERVMRILAAAAAGKSSGGPGSPTYRNLADGANQIAGTADGSGNRTAVTYGG